jgi:hypothetical protein
LDSQQGQKNLLCAPKRPDRLWCPSSLIFNEYGGGGLSQGVKRLEREVDHSYLLPGLGTSGRIPSLPHAFKSCAKENFNLPFLWKYIIRICLCLDDLYWQYWSDISLFSDAHFLAPLWKCVHCSRGYVCVVFTVHVGTSVVCSLCTWVRP